MRSDDLIGKLRAAAPEQILGDRFVLGNEAGAGGMGVVYRASDRETGRAVALKILRETDATTLRRFDVEAEALGRLDHPAIVRYLAHGISEEGEPYLAMEWVEGTSLHARLARTADDEPFDLQSIVALGARIAGALAAAHALGIVHRDVKPSNILLPDHRLEDAKLADFGIARGISAPISTASGQILGTVGYVAPEQARGDRDLDGRADLFSLGCVLFRCLTHRNVFEGDAPVTVLAQLLLNDAPRVSDIRTDVPPALDDLVARLLAKERAARPESAARVEEELAGMAMNLLDRTQTQLKYVLPRALERQVTEAKSGPPARWRRIPRKAAMALAAVPIVTSLAFVLSRAISPASSASPTSASESASPRPTAITDLPISSECSADAISAYQSGVQALRQANWQLAHHFFEQAAEADPSCPEAQLRLLMTAESHDPTPRVREHVRRALALRDRLGERDRMVLDSFAVTLADESPRPNDAIRGLEEAVRRFPDDAELLFLAAFRRIEVARDRAYVEGTLDLARRASFIDPGYADPWQLQARVLGSLRQYEDELAALDRCNEAAPDAVDCLDERVQVLRRIGRCHDMATSARRLVSLNAKSPGPRWQLALALAAEGADRSAVEEALRPQYELLPPPQRAWMELSERARIAAWFGDFDDALGLAADLGREAERTGNANSHLAHAMVWVDLLREVGKLREASRAAGRFLAAKKGWVKKELRVPEIPFYEPWFLSVQLEAGELTPASWRVASEAWNEANRSTISDFERWILRWGTAVGPRIDAAEAMRHGPPAATDSTSALNITARMNALETYEGRVHLHAGDAAAATRLFDSTARSCDGLRAPFLHMQSYLGLGMSKERLGDTAGACTAYRAVLDRWGATKSVTAREARERSVALRCRLSD